MDEHFRSVLDEVGGGERGRGKGGRDVFLPSSTFTGARAGYVFKADNQGVGYYLDPSAETDARRGVKRGRGVARANGDGTHADDGSAGADGYDDDDERDGKKGKGKLDKPIEEMSLDELDEETIQKMLAEADENTDIVELDPQGLKQLQLRLERAINTNQMMRVKYADEPERFVESEVDLDEALKALSAVAAAPELYPQLVEANTVTSILGLLTHENTDISISAINLLQELTDVDSISETDNALALVESLIEQQGAELLVQNLSRLDEANEEDARGVNATMAILESLLESKPSVGPYICEKTALLKFLLQRLRVKRFDENKLYCSEILCILVNSDSDIQKRLGTTKLQGVDGVDHLLQVAAHYRRRDPGSPEEEECVENIFDALAGAMLIPENQNKFREGEGFELMVRCLREKKYAAWCAVKVLDFACTDNPTNCERLVECSGLKAVMPVFMGRAAAKKLRKKKKKGKGERNTLEEHVVSLITSLALYLEDKKDRECLTRFVGKFIENDCEKLERASDLYLEYSERVAQWDRRHDENGGGTGEDSDEEESLALDRLESGGYTQQRLAVIMMTAAAHSKVVHARLVQLLHQHNLNVRTLRSVLEGYLEVLQQATMEDNDDGNGNGVNGGVRAGEEGKHGEEEDDDEIEEGAVLSTSDRNAITRKLMKRVRRLLPG